MSATGTLAPVALQQFFNALGQPLSGGTLATYVTGTSTPSPVYTDKGCLIPFPNPLTIDAAGYPTNGGGQANAIYLPAVTQKWVLLDQFGVLQWTADPVQSTDLLTADAIAQVLALVPATGGLSTYVGATNTGAVNNWAPGLAGNTVIEWTGTGAVTYSGIAGGVAGQVVTFRNNGTALALFLHASGLSTAGNKFLNAVTSAGTPVNPGGWVTYVYDGTQWILTAHEQGQWITPTFAAGNFTGATLMTWTVTSGEVAAMRYHLDGTALTVCFQLNNTTVGGTPSATLQIGNAAWGGFSADGGIYNAGLGQVVDDSSVVAAYTEVDASGTLIRIIKTSQAAWTASAALTSINGTIVIGVA